MWIRLDSLAGLRILKDWDCVSAWRESVAKATCLLAISAPACFLVAGSVDAADVFVSSSTSGLALKLQFCLSLVDSGIKAEPPHPAFAHILEQSWWCLSLLLGPIHTYTSQAHTFLGPTTQVQELIQSDLGALLWVKLTVWRPGHSALPALFTLNGNLRHNVTS